MALKTNSHSALPFVLTRCGAGSAEEREGGKLQLGYCTYLGLDVATMCSAEGRVPECWVTSFLPRLRKEWETRRTERPAAKMLISDQSVSGRDGGEACPRAVCEKKASVGECVGRGEGHLRAPRVSAAQFPDWT